jgi:flagellar biosynthesis protein FlhB
MSGEGQDDDSERSHAPTEKRLQDAYQKGDGPLSADITTAAAYSGFALAATMLGGAALVAAGGTLALPLAQADRLAGLVFGGTGGLTVMGGLVWAGFAPVIPWFAIPAACALLAILAQGAARVAPEKLAPRWSRLSPVAGLKQKLSGKGLVEFIKSLVKLAIYGAVLGALTLAALPHLLIMPALMPAQAMEGILRETLSMLLIVTGLAIAFGLADLFWQHLSFRNRNMMTRKEVTDEYKESEGDPHLKGQRRQRGQSIALNQMLADVPKASVVLLNPTHYAVALSWDPASGRAPVCLAKGTDEIAARIRETATAHGIPLHRDPPTARALFAAVEVGQEIGRDHYRAVAAAIRFAERLRRKRT